MSSVPLSSIINKELLHSNKNFNEEDLQKQIYFLDLADQMHFFLHDSDLLDRIEEEGRITEDINFTCTTIPVNQ